MGRIRGASRTRDDLVDQALYRIAALLLKIGLDAPAAEKLLRRAFVLAASDSAKITARRPTQSNVASIAGVSRREVRTIGIRRAMRELPSDASSGGTRLQKIIDAWCADPRFSDRRGKPKPLLLKQGVNSFDRLVKSYGRDVTTKTLKDQLVQEGLAKEQSGSLVLLARNATRMKNAGDADLAFVASQLRAIDFQFGSRAYVTRRVSIHASDRKSAYRIRRIAIQRLGPLLNSIASISSSPVGKKNRSKPRFRILLSAAIATEEGVSQ
jgi:hypothetical protein